VRREEREFAALREIERVRGEVSAVGVEGREDRMGRAVERRSVARARRARALRCSERMECERAIAKHLVAGQH